MCWLVVWWWWWLAGSLVSWLFDWVLGSGWLVVMVLACLSRGDSVCCSDWLGVGGDDWLASSGEVCLLWLCWMLVVM